MRLDLGGHPLHTRALSVVVGREAQGLSVSADLLDLRKRGFTPVGTEMQGAGIIHQMGLDAHLAGGVITRLAARQPVVAFEASAATRGESCRTVVTRVAALIGTACDDSARLREALGGALGCSHLLAAAQLLCATAAAYAGAGGAAPVQATVLRRDLVFDGHDRGDGRLAIGIQLSDLHTEPAAAGERPMARFAGHDELRLWVDLDGWPARVVALRGAERRRRLAQFATAPWVDLTAALAPLTGVTLGKGSAPALRETAAGRPALQAALQQLGPALIQCRASFPDKWLNVAATTPGHAALIGMADSCYMWRRGGALQQVRESSSDT